MSIATKASIIGFAVFSVFNLVTREGFRLAVMWGGLLIVNHLADRLKEALVGCDKEKP